MVEFSAFVVEHRPGLVNLARYVYRLQPADAEDLVQGALVKTAAKWTSLRDPLAYARRAVITAGIDRHRRLGRRLVEHPLEDIAESRLVSREAEPLVSERMQSALHDLPELSRKILVLRYYVGLTEEETAAALRRPVGSVKSAAHRGIARLRISLHPSEIDDERSLRG